MHLISRFLILFHPLANANFGDVGVDQMLRGTKLAQLKVLNLAGMSAFVLST
jgi:hypothetical protein